MAVVCDMGVSQTTRGQALAGQSWLRGIFPRRISTKALAPALRTDALRQTHATLASPCHVGKPMPRLATHARFPSPWLSPNTAYPPTGSPPAPVLWQNGSPPSARHPSPNRRRQGCRRGAPDPNKQPDRHTRHLPRDCRRFRSGPPSIRNAGTGAPQWWQSAEKA